MMGSPLSFQVELAGLYDRLGRHDEAEVRFGRAREELMAHLSRWTAAELLELRLDRVRSAWWTKHREKLVSEDDERLARSLVDMLRRDEPTSLHFPEALDLHARVLEWLGRTEETLGPLRERVTALEAIESSSHPAALQTKNALAWRLVELGRPEEAEPIAHAV